MKRRLVSILIAIVMLFSSVPVAFATNVIDDQQELIDLACEIFPEYANKILYQKALPPSVMRISDVELVHSESRNVSNSKTLLYSEYSNGIILLTETENEPAEVKYVDITSGSSSTVYTINIKATCTDAYGTFNAENIKFTLISSAYDRIDSKGTYSFSNPEMLGFIGCQLVNTAPDPNPRVVWNESASGNAEIEYMLMFRFAAYAGSFLNTHLVLDVGDNNYIVSHKLH